MWVSDWVWVRFVLLRLSFLSEISCSLCFLMCLSRLLKLSMRMLILLCLFAGICSEKLVSLLRMCVIVLVSWFSGCLTKVESVVSRIVMLMVRISTLTSAFCYIIVVIVFLRWVYGMIMIMFARCLLRISMGIMVVMLLELWNVVFIMFCVFVCTVGVSDLVTFLGMRFGLLWNRILLLGVVTNVELMLL